MLLAINALLWYGPGAAALVASPGTGFAQAQPVMNKRSGASMSGTGVAAVLRPFRGSAFALALGGEGALVAQARKRIRPALAVSIGGALTQDDVTGAVLESKVEGDLTLKQAIRLLLAQAQGNATGLDSGSITFKSLDGTTTRIAGTIAAGDRTITSRNTD
jgi:hypothetical protein